MGPVYGDVGMGGPFAPSALIKLRHPNVANAVPFFFSSAVSPKELASKLMEGERLPRPGLCVDSAYAAMQRCWAASPASRPTFRQLQGLLRTAEDMTDDNGAPLGGEGGSGVWCEARPFLLVVVVDSSLGCLFPGSRFAGCVGFESTLAVQRVVSDPPPLTTRAAPCR